MYKQITTIIGSAVLAIILIGGVLFWHYKTPRTASVVPDTTVSPELLAPNLRDLPNELWIAHDNSNDKILLQSDNVFRKYDGETQTGYGKWESSFFDDDGYGIGEVVFTYAPEGTKQKHLIIVSATPKTLTLFDDTTKKETLYILTQPTQN